VGVHAVSAGIVIDDETLPEHDTVFVKFVTDSIALLSKSRTGAGFLNEFNPSKAGVNGGDRYASATVLIRPPSRASITQIKSVAETGHLTYFLEDNLLFLRDFCGRPKDSYVCAADFAKNVNLAKDVPKAELVLKKYPAEKFATFAPVCLKIPANTRGTAWLNCNRIAATKSMINPMGRGWKGR
jgi:hypothetical protein